MIASHRAARDHRTRTQRTRAFVAGCSSARLLVACSVDRTGAFGVVCECVFVLPRVSAWFVRVLCGTCVRVLACRRVARVRCHPLLPLLLLLLVPCAIDIQINLRGRSVVVVPTLPVLGCRTASAQLACPQVGSIRFRLLASWVAMINHL